MIRVTIDTGPWIDLLDRRGCVDEMDLMLTWQHTKSVCLFASSRVFEPDTNAMHPHQRAGLRSLFDKHGVELMGAPFRGDVSRIGDLDLVSGPALARSKEELKRFVEIVGPDPSTLPPSALGKAFSRKVGDYDALMTHFTAGNEVFVTLDTKDYLHTARRATYASELNLIVQSPTEFVAAFEARL